MPLRNTPFVEGTPYSRRQELSIFWRDDRVAAGRQSETLLGSVDLRGCFLAGLRVSGAVPRFWLFRDRKHQCQGSISNGDTRRRRFRTHTRVAENGRGDQARPRQAAPEGKQVGQETQTGNPGVCEIRHSVHDPSGFRGRCQVQLVLKRFKSRSGLEHLPKYDNASARARLFGKLVTARCWRRN